MNSEKLHINNSSMPEIGGLSNEQLERLRNEITKELGRRTVEAMKLLIDKIEGKSDEEYEDLVNRANSGDAEAQKELTEYQEARAKVKQAEALKEAVAETVARKQAEAKAEAEPAAEVKPTVEAEEPAPAASATEAAVAEAAEPVVEADEAAASTTEAVSDMSDLEDGMENLNGILSEDEMKNVLEGRDYDDYGDGVPIQNFEDTDKTDKTDEATDDAPIRAFEAEGDEAENEVESEDENEDGNENAAESEDENEDGNENAAENEAELVDKISDIMEQKAAEIVAELENGSIEKVEEELEDEFEEEIEEVEPKRKGRIKKFFAKHPKLMKAAIIAITAISSLTGIGIAFSSNTVGDDAAKVSEARGEAGSGVYNEWAASRLAKETDAARGESLENDYGKKDTEEKEDTAEKISSTAKFEIDGKEFTYENMKHEGGYDKGMDSFYDDDKDGKHSMAGPAYEGKWNGSAEQIKESYDGLMAALKGSPEIASSIAMAAGIPGAENIHSQTALNDFADELRNKDAESFDKFMTAASDYINNFVNGGRIEVSTIKAGEHYRSSYTYGSEGDLEIGIDKDVKHDNFDVQVLDFFDENGNSMFNSDEAKASIREMFGLSSKTEFTAGWSARCGQIVVQVEQRQTEFKDRMDTISARLDSFDDELSPVTEEDELPEVTEEPKDEEETPEVTEETPEETSTPAPTQTPEVTPTPEPTQTPEVIPTPTPEQTLAPKTENTNAGNNQQQMDPTEINNNDTKVTAEEQGNVNPNVAPGAAVEGTNTEGVNTETINPGGLNQTETTPAPDLSNSASETENVQRGGDAQSLAERMQRAEQAEQQARAAQQAEQAERNQ